MKVILAILSISLAYASGFESQDALDQYIAINYSAELNRTDLSPKLLREEVVKTKVLVEVAKTTRLAAEHFDMENALAFTKDHIAQQRVTDNHDNKRFLEIEKAFDPHQATLDAQDNIITAGDLQTAWYAILRVKVAAAELILQTN